MGDVDAFLLSPRGLPCSSCAHGAPLAPTSDRRSVTAFASSSRRRCFCVDDQPLKSLSAQKSWRMARPWHWLNIRPESRSSPRSKLPNGIRLVRISPGDI